jgi:hypothetical protein
MRYPNTGLADKYKDNQFIIGSSKSCHRRKSVLGILT